ncbi:hypothetical protein IL306_007487 [Fusarium sp. DS 682]|nr:hypothetical protein IL306_007487 [Fusarium sp. DS 682]
MGIWDIDPVCEPHRTALDQGFDVALEMATAAYNAIDFLRKPRPAKRQRKQHLEWLVKSRALQAALGLTVQEDGMNPPDDLIFAQTTFSRIKERLTQSSDVINRTWNPILKSLGYNKPHIVCGENTEGDKPNFIWVGADDPVPGEGGVLLKDYRDAKHNVEKGVAGAWLHHSRMIYQFPAQAEKKGFLCRPGESALTDYLKDWIVFCGRSFRPEAQRRISPKTYKENDGKTKKQKDRIDDKIVVGTPLRNIAGHLSVTVLHELLHWYGLPQTNSEGRPIPGKYSKLANVFVCKTEEGIDWMLMNTEISDVPAVNKDGKYMYRYPDRTRTDFRPSETLLTDDEMKKEKLTIVGAYGQTHVWNLAKFRNDEKKIRPVANADSLAYFALMV